MSSATNQQMLYAGVIRSLVASVMRAQAEIVSALLNGSEADSVPHSALNRHFSWLCLEFSEGTNRHLFEASTGLFPLRTSALRNRAAIPGPILKSLGDRLPPPGIEEATKPKRRRKGSTSANGNPFVQQDATRISALVRQSFQGQLGESAPAHSPEGEKERLKHPPKKRQPQPIVLKSALAIALDYLTVPYMPGTRAYALVSLRNYLFEQFGIVPDIHSELETRSPPRFSVSELTESLSRINTSIRLRFDSRGEDKLPPEGRLACDGLVRQYLAMRGAFNCRFRNYEVALQYLNRGELRARKVPLHGHEFEYAKSPFLEKLPEAGEIVNEIWGLPIPIRGAETVFRGGLKFTANQGLVIAVHGGPGTGKTALALAFGAYCSPFGIRTLFITAEEEERDLRARMVSLIPDEMRRLSVFPDDKKFSIDIEKIPLPVGDGLLLEELNDALATLANRLANDVDEDRATEDHFRVPKPCRTIVVLDGLHDLFSQLNSEGYSDGAQVAWLYPLVATLKKLQALVLITTGLDLAAAKSLDYMVDVAIHLSHESLAEFAAKPQRHLKLTKARHQAAAAGTHGLQLAGPKGVRLSPQINYQLDRQAIWKTRLPRHEETHDALRRVMNWKAFERLVAKQDSSNSIPSVADFAVADDGPIVFGGSHIFINGQGSGGKAALALKIATAPCVRKSGTSPRERDRVLIVSFLYPPDYYTTVAGKIKTLRSREYGREHVQTETRIKTIQLHPGHLRPNDLYNKIEWELEAAVLEGQPYTCVIIDGIHNIFVQFPEIQRYSLFWPQIYYSLRIRGVMTITTHTILRAPELPENSPTAFFIDDERSEPLRNVLVQKTDFQLEVDPYVNLTAEEMGGGAGTAEPLADLFWLRTLSSIDQPVPKRPVLWSREHMCLVQPPNS